uniref:Uncharacterized protein n=1 Tax=Oryza brachyantha TaxID=4533 RepID=J3KZL7_ORYBR
MADRGVGERRAPPQPLTVATTLWKVRESAWFVVDSVGCRPPCWIGLLRLLEIFYCNGMAPTELPIAWCFCPPRRSQPTNDSSHRPPRQ